MIQCSKHGLQHIALTSPLVQQLISNSQPLKEKLFYVCIYIDLFEDYGCFWSNIDFADSLGVPYQREGQSILIQGLGEEKSFEIYGRTVPVCIACHTEFTQENGLVAPDKTSE